MMNPPANPPGPAAESFPASAASCFQALDRHELRRRQGIPTLSVLAGPINACAAAWREWAAVAGRPGGVAVWPDNEEDHQENPPPEPASSFVRAAWLFLPRDRENKPAHEKAAELSHREPGRLARAVEILTQRLEALGERQSTLALALAVEPAEAEAYLCSAPECRAKAFFREGLIVLEPLQQPAAATNPAAQPTAPAALPLAREKVRPETAARFQEASLACQEAREKASDPEESNRTQDRARSAAEGFLFELLADLPETAGCFALNAPLDFCFGPKRAEVDLLAAGLRLAVEIDGYRHFQDAEAYRRDRRKDALLQKQGYLVLRFLAEDVVTRLEVILEEIRAAVAFRKVASGGQPS